MGWGTALNTLWHDDVTQQTDPASLHPLEQLTAAHFGTAKHKKERVTWSLIDHSWNRCIGRVAGWVFPSWPRTVPVSEHGRRPYCADLETPAPVWSGKSGF
jgi:hypothetical protein